MWLAAVLPGDLDPEARSDNSLSASQRKRKKRGRRKSELPSVTCKAHHYREIDLVITVWEYWKGLVEAPLPLKYLWSFLQLSRLSQLGGNSSCPAAVLV